MDIQTLRPHAIDSLRTILMEVEYHLNYYKYRNQSNDWDMITSLLDARSILKDQITTLTNSSFSNEEVAELVVEAMGIEHRDYDNLAREQEEDNFYLYG